ncbi:unnamed protein product [Diamesa serratosioi]
MELSKNRIQKLGKKIKRCQLLISQDNSALEFSDSPELHIVILNNGLSNGLSVESVIEEVAKCEQQLSDVVMIPKKSYCFLKFHNLESAVIIFEQMNGISKLGQNDSVLLMSYCKNVPSVDNAWNQLLPNGLIVLENFVTEEMEQKLISELQWEESGEENKLKHRKVQHFGYEFLYGANTVDLETPLSKQIPKDCDLLWKNLSEKLPQFSGWKPDQLTVNRYEPGNGIPAHCDTHSRFEDPIISLSLGSDVVMEFRQPETKVQSSVLLPRRSLLVMSGESRYGWTHGITSRINDVVVTSNGNMSVRKRNLRLSFTFRKIKIPDTCSCNFSSLCDKVTPINHEEDYDNKVDEKLAAKLEIENVHKVYNEIGSHFSETRHSPWPNVEDFLNGLQDGSVLLDVGCGNGKYLSVNEKLVKMGCDRSDSLLKVCSERNFNSFQCDCLALPVRDNSVDACLSIAVIHHLATKERRLTAIKEMTRVLVSGGKALIYVWAKDQAKDDKKSSYLKQNPKQKKDPEEAPVILANSNSISLPVHKNRTQFQAQNVFVPWKLKNTTPDVEQKVFMRYYHVFEENELEKMCLQVNNLKVNKSYYDQGNWCVILEKK